MLTQTEALAQSEKIVLRMPETFKIGFQKGNMTEWVPLAESVKDWSELITIQTYQAAASITQAQFLGGVGEKLLRFCPETPIPRMTTGQTNGYPVSMLLLACPKNSNTGKPETTAFRSILGGSDIYFVQYAFRYVPSSNQIATAMKFLGTVSVCDTEKAGHPCPEVLSPNIDPTSANKP